MKAYCPDACPTPSVAASSAPSVFAKVRSASGLATIASTPASQAAMAPSHARVTSSGVIAEKSGNPASTTVMVVPPGARSYPLPRYHGQASYRGQSPAAGGSRRRMTIPVVLSTAVTMLVASSRALVASSLRRYHTN